MAGSSLNVSFLDRASMCSSPAICCLPVQPAQSPFRQEAHSVPDEEAYLLPATSHALPHMIHKHCAVLVMSCRLDSEMPTVVTLRLPHSSQDLADVAQYACQSRLRAVHIHADYLQACKCAVNDQIQGVEGCRKQAVASIQPGLSAPPGHRADICRACSTTHEISKRRDVLFLAAWGWSTALMAAVPFCTHVGRHDREQQQARAVTHCMLLHHLRQRNWYRAQEPITPVSPKAAQQ